MADGGPRLNAHHWQSQHSSSPPGGALRGRSFRGACRTRSPASWQPWWQVEVRRTRGTPWAPEPPRGVAADGASREQAVPGTHDRAAGAPDRLALAHRSQPAPAASGSASCPPRTTRAAFVRALTEGVELSVGVVAPRLRHGGAGSPCLLKALPSAGAASETDRDPRRAAACRRTVTVGSSSSSRTAPSTASPRWSWASAQWPSTAESSTIGS